MKACKHCEHWKQRDETLPYGKCRRYAPSPKRDKAASSGEWYWCTTMDDDWCGEFKVIEPPLHPYINE